MFNKSQSFLTKQFKLERVNANNLVEQVTVEQPTDFYFLVDVSGSMYYDLPHLREHLKNKLADALKPNDTLTVIYYSTNGKFGYVLNRYSIKDIDSIEKSKKLIDRWLQPMGLTGFLDPINLTIENINENKSDNAKYFVFMSDGYENQNNTGKIIKALEELKDLVDESVIVEYGNYANHDLLSQMADTLTGQFIYSEQFEDFNLEVDRIFENIISSKKFQYNLPSDTLLAYLTDTSGNITLISGNEATFSEVQTLNIISEVSYNDSKKLKYSDDGRLYQVLYASTLDNNADIMFAIMDTVKDAGVMQKYEAAIGKQRYNQFLEYLRLCSTDETTRKMNTFTSKNNTQSILELFDILGQDDNNYFVVKDLNYNRIGAKTVSKATTLTNEDKELLQNASSLDEVNQVMTSKVNLKFESEDYAKGKFSDLVMNASRANVSIRTTVSGFVDLNNHPEFKQFNKVLPHIFSTYRFRNYTFIKDGIVNIPQFKALISKDTYQKLVDNEYFNYVTEQDDGYYLIDISELPVVNRKALTGVTANNMVNLFTEREQYKAKIKVLTSLMKEIQPRESKKFKEMYGEEAASWLKTLGITDYSGFNPPSVKVKSEDGDFYYAPSIELKYKGAASIPSLNSVLKKAQAGKSLNVYETVMNNIYNDWSDSDYESLNDEKNRLVEAKRSVEFELAKIVFAKLLSRQDFLDFEKLDEKSNEERIWKFSDPQIRILEKEEQVSI
jgi:hypothetical protein